MHFPTLEEQVDDVLAVLDAAGCQRAALFGLGQAACWPACSRRLIRAEGYPRGREYEEFRRLLRITEEGWGQGVALPVLAPTMTGDESFKRWFAKLERLGASPGNMLALLQLHREVDVRPVLPAIRVPTLVLHRAGDAYREVGHGRYLAAHIAGAKCVELPGRDHLPYAGDQDAVLDEVEEFLTGVRRGPEPDRVLATLLLGLELRSGLHTGEIELAGEHIRGIAVHIGARVMSMAGPGEALVSSTVKDLVAGSRIEFEDRGEHTLKGAPRMWRIFLAVSA